MICFMLIVLKLVQNTCYLHKLANAYWLALRETLNQTCEEEGMNNENNELGYIVKWFFIKKY